SDRQPLVDVGVEGDEADLVLHAIADVADEHRRVDGVIEARNLRDARGHAVALVEAEQDLLRAVETELADDEPPVPRRGAPGDVAVVIVEDVVAQAVELAPFADARRGARAEAAESEGVELLVEAFDRAQVREDV